MLLSYFLLVTLTIISVSATSPRCGSDSSFYYNNTLALVTTCRCPKRTGSVLSRIETPISGEYTESQGTAATRCIFQNNRHLARACDHGIDIFVHRATSTNKKCIRQTPNNEEKNLKGDFVISKGKCKAIKVGFKQKFNSIVWICTCTLAKDDIVTGVIGRAQFDPLSEEESKMVSECTTKDKPLLMDVCTKSSADFSLSALHSLQTCCKRVRAKSNSKFKCDVVVPKDVSPLKFPV